MPVSNEGVDTPVDDNVLNTSNTVDSESEVEETANSTDTGNTNTSVNDDVLAINKASQDIINNAKLTTEEEETLKSIETSDVLDETITGMSTKIHKSGKHMVFAVVKQKKPVALIEAKAFNYSVTDNVSAMRKARDGVLKAIKDMGSFTYKYATLSELAEIKGMDNVKSMKNFISYFTSASKELTEIGDIITRNIGTLNSGAKSADNNVDWLAEEENWYTNNGNEKDSMRTARDACRKAVLLLETELREVKNQLSTLEIRTASTSTSRDAMIRRYLQEKSAIKAAKVSILHNSTITKLNSAHAATVAALIAKQLKADKAAFAEFTRKIKALNDKHDLEMASLRAKHVKDMEEARLSFEKKLAAQALAFSKILDEANTKHADAIADLHTYYETKIAKIVAGYETTIKELKALVKDYSKKLERANKLISSYYSALDASQKSQADMLQAYKDIAEKKTEAISDDLQGKRLDNMSQSGKPKESAPARLTGGLALNAAIGLENEKTDAAAAAAAEKKAKDDELAKAAAYKQKLLIGGGAAITVVGGIAAIMLSRKRGSGNNANYKNNANHNGGGSNNQGGNNNNNGGN